MKKIENSTYYYNVFKFEKFEIVLIAEKAQMNSDSVIKKWISCKQLKRDFKKKTTIIKTTSSLIINLIVKAIKTVNKVNMKQFFMTEIVKDFSIINSSTINS